MNFEQEKEKIQKLERNVPVSKLKVGDIVGPEERYITTTGTYIDIGRKCEVIRLNKKTITVKLCGVTHNLMRIPRKAIVCHYLSPKNGRCVVPKFGRLIAT